MSIEMLSKSSVARECCVNMGDNLLPRLNICERPIAHKYREGKMQRTLERESKDLETVKSEGMSTSIWQHLPCLLQALFVSCLLLVENGFLQPSTSVTSYEFVQKYARRIVRVNSVAVMFGKRR